MKSLRHQKSWLLILIALTLCVSLCNSCTPPANEDGNQPPVIESLTAEPLKLILGKTSTVTCVASDPDGDELSYLWTTKYGEFSGEGSSIVWTAPTKCGVHNISVTVIDSKSGKITDKIEVGVVISG